MPIVLKSRNLKLLEFAGPVQVCSGLFRRVQGLLYLLRSIVPNYAAILGNNNVSHNLRTSLI